MFTEDRKKKLSEDMKKLWSNPIWRENHKAKNRKQLENKKLIAIQNPKICEICKKEIVASDKTVEHHTSYFPEVKIIIHEKCHMHAHSILRETNPKLAEDYIEFNGKNSSHFCIRRPKWCKTSNCKGCNKIRNQ